MNGDEFLAAVGDLPERVRYAVFSFHEAPPGQYHVTALLQGETPAACLNASHQILAVAKGKQTWVRVPPQAESHRDFSTNQVIHAGYVRFSFSDQPGEHIDLAPVPLGETRYAGFPGGPR